jgi:hypothetical protein
MISSCDRAVGQTFWGGNGRVADTSICSMADLAPPLSLEPHVRDWMEERESLLQAWNLSIIEWEKRYLRTRTCMSSWELANERVEITEHDAVVKEL